VHARAHVQRVHPWSGCSGGLTVAAWLLQVGWVLWLTPPAIASLIAAQIGSTCQPLAILVLLGRFVAVFVAALALHVCTSHCPLPSLSQPPSDDGLPSLTHRTKRRRVGCP